MDLVTRGTRKGALLLIKFYQLALSPLIGKQCRFYPSCSHYAAEAFSTRPLHRAFLLTLSRILRCGPWHPGGVDLLD